MRGIRALQAPMAIAVVSLALLPAPARAQTATSAPDRGRAFVPRPVSEALYDTQNPDEDPERQRAFVTADDGVDLYVETWLPKRKKGGPRVPARIPTILIMTPYVVQGAHRYPPSGKLPNIIEYFTQRGYAVAQHHVRGTGESGGCLEQTAQNQIADGANVVAYLGRDAPWSNGKVGMYGRSYDAETQISTAAFGDPDKIKFLKAIVPIASVGSQYDWNFMDGVPWTLQPFIGNAAYLVTSAEPGTRPAPQHYPEKATCQDEVMGSSKDQNGDYTEYWQEREYRHGARNVKAATFMVHGLRDFNVQDITLAGFFDRLPRTTPHKGLFGVWDHATPGSHDVGASWARADFLDMTTAWFDRYLKGKATDVESWPDVQLQGSDGQWWTVGEYPTMGGPLGQLALGPDGSLGATTPKGETSYTEQLHIGEPEEGESAVFETAAVKAPLHVTGQPMLDLWVMSDVSDGHIAAELEVLGPDGEPAENVEAHATYGVRSLQHIDPMRRGWFEQETSKPFTTDEAVNVIVRLLPTDLVIPKGGKLRLTISGSVSYSKGDSLPSGARATITLLHNCDHPSFLRFRIPDPDAELLNAREQDEMHLKKLVSRPEEMGRMDGGGLATQRVCNQRPRALPFL